MKNAFITLIVALAVASCTVSSKHADGGNELEDSTSSKLYYVPNPSGFVIEKGVNLSHWVSQCFGWSPRDKFITESDIALIDSLGYDHVRLPVDEEELFHEDGTFKDTALNYVKSCIDWCLKRDLRVVFDLHILRSHHFNSRNGEGKMTLWTDSAAQNNFLYLWDKLSDELKQYPNSMLAYEPMNEPVAPEHEMWNALLLKMVKSIRKKEPERVIIFGSNRWQLPYTYPFLEVPEGDKNIILSFHSYHPYFLTHRNAYWSVAKNYHGEVHYPGVTISEEDFKKYVDTTDSALMARIEEEKALSHHDRNTLVEVFHPAIKKAYDMKLQLYCNEFGCLPAAPKEMRKQYYEDVVSIFNEYNIAFANWDFKGDFGIVGWDRENYVTMEVDTMVVNALMK